jgi:hypothetical protein
MKKVDRVSSGNLFQFDIFWIYMLWGIQNNKPNIFARTFGLTSLSAWCVMSAGGTTIITKQFSYLKPSLWTTTRQCDCLKNYLCMATWPGCYNWQFGRIEKMSKISFFAVTHAQSCWTVVDSTKSVSAVLSDFGLCLQLKVESEIKSPWTLKTIYYMILKIFFIKLNI